MVQLEYCPIVGSGGCNKRDIDIASKRDTFFLAESFFPEKDRERRETAIKMAIKEALTENFDEFSFNFGDKEPTEPAIFCDICQKIQACEYGIVELSDLNPNVLLEFGMMLALGKPVFVLIKNSEQEKIKSRMPSNVIWKRAIPYDEEIDLIDALISPLAGRQHLKFKPSVEKVDLKYPLEKYYKSVEKWFREVGKKGYGKRSFGRNMAEQKRTLSRVLDQYCQAVKMSPDEIITDAQKEKMALGGTVKSHEERLQNYLYSLDTQSKGHLYWSYLKGGFYGHNGIHLDIERPEYKPQAIFGQITTEQLRKMCDVATTVRSRSWILANSYMGLDAGQLNLLKVEDFHLDKWAETKEIYPVTIREDVSGTFEYYTFIGTDAKIALEEYLKTVPHGQQDFVWGMVRQTFIGEFNRERKLAHIDPNDDFNGNGQARKLPKITTKALGKRLKDTLEETILPSDRHLIDYLLGIKRDGVKTPLFDDVEKAYLKVLPKLTVYQGQIPPIKSGILGIKKKYNKPSKQAALF